MTNVKQIPWTAEEDEKLRQLYAAGARPREVVAALAPRTLDAIKTRAMAIGARRPDWYTQEKGRMAAAEHAWATANSPAHKRHRKKFEAIRRPTLFTQLLSMFIRSTGEPRSIVIPGEEWWFKPTRKAELDGLIERGPDGRWSLTEAGVPEAKIAAARMARWKQNRPPAAEVLAHVWE